MFGVLIHVALAIERLDCVYAKNEPKQVSERARGEDFGKSGIQSWVLSLASCFESINSKTTLLIDIIDSNNNVPLYILWLYRLNDTNNSTAANLRLDLFPTSSSSKLMKKFLIN